MLTIKTTGLEDYLDPSGGNAWVQALIIGDHGVGKTPFAGKWPKPIFAMCEHGTMSIAKDKLPYGEIFTDADADAFVAVVKRDTLLPLDKRQYLTVVVDTIDSYQKRLMDHRVVTQSLERFTGWDNWDWLDAKVAGLLRRLSALPIHLVVNMHYKKIMVGEGDDKTLDREAKLKGDLKTTIYQEFDLIGFMETYYLAEGGERKRKHRIRWWPEPGFEMVRARAVGEDGVLLPQYTPVEFTTQDFQIIFDSIVSGVDGLEESQVIEQVETATDVPDAADVPAPDQGAGPVSTPSLPPANRTVEPKKKRGTIEAIKDYVGTDKERAQAAIDAENAHEDGVRRSLITAMEKVLAADTAPAEPAAEPDSPADTPEPETAEPAGQEPPAEASAADTPEDTPAPSPDNGKGTAEVPVVMEEKKLNDLDGPKYAALDHVHSPEGKCLKNGFVGLGPDGKRHCPLVEEAPAETPAETPVEEVAEAPVEETPMTVEEVAAAVEGTPVEEPAAPATPAPVAAGDGPLCGQQPESLVGKFEAKVKGCGKVLTPSNKAPLAVVKHKTQLCTDCFAQAA